MTRSTITRVISGATSRGWEQHFDHLIAAIEKLIKEEQGDRGDIPLGGCAAGVSGMTILPDGTLTPCRRLYIPVGNIRKDSFREVWATSEVLEGIRDRSRYKGKCGSCKRWADCRGCRAIAYAFSRAQGKSDFLAEDPQCFIGSN